MDHGAAETDELKPTYRGIIVSAEDMLILVEACLSNHVSCARRPLSRKEKDEVARSGNVFIYEENATSSKLWVDGMSWSLRQFQNGYSMYRQVNITDRKLHTLAKRQRIAAESNSSSISIEARQAVPKTQGDIDAQDNDQPLATESDTTSREKLAKPKSEFVEGGLFKKRMNLRVGAIKHCLVSYYSVADAEEQGKLQRPSKDPRFSGLEIRQEFLEEWDRVKSSRNRRKAKEKESLHEDRSQLHSGNTLRGVSNPSSPIGDAGMPTLDPSSPVGDAGTPALDPPSPVAVAGTPALDPSSPVGDAGTPALDPSSPVGDAGTPALDSDLYDFIDFSPPNLNHGMGDAGMPALDPEDIEMFSTSLKQQDPNSGGASAPESYQQGPHPHTNPST